MDRWIQAKAQGETPRGRAPRLRRGDAGVYLHALAADSEIAVRAGRALWGHPRFIAEIAIATGEGRARCELSRDGREVLRLEVREGGPLRLSDPNLPNYAAAGGVVVESAWDQEGAVRARLGGGRLALGSHPMATELGALGIGRRALTAATMRGLRATLGRAVEIGRVT